MVEFINIADLKDPDDPRGRSYRQVNAEKVHAIPIGSLVEVENETHPERSGARLFVVYHGRDCDETPLYWLSPYPDDTERVSPYHANPKWIGGYSEGGLKVIRPPAAPEG